MPSAAILTGGRARRFGGLDKGLLIVGGRTIRDRQMAALAPLVDDILLVGDREAEAPTPGVRLVTDRRPGVGPLGGLDAALAAAQHDVLVVLACDLPGITTALLAELLRLLPGHQAVVPRTSSGYHPLCAAYTRDVHLHVRRRLSEGVLDMRGLLQDLNVRDLTEPDLAGLGDPARLLANVNTPSDCDEIDALLTHGP
jgi:molybdopterin-guanine dinucleotide biosynthesis protein A